MNRIIRTFRKGAYVRYIGNDPHRKEYFGDNVYQIRHKIGDMVIGYFPYKPNGEKHRFCEYAIPCKELEIVIQTPNGYNSINNCMNA